MVSIHLLRTISYPVLIQFPNGGSGSGFYLNFNNKRLYLATAKHVIYKKFTGNELILNSSKITTLSYDKDLSKKTPIKNVLDLDMLNVYASSDSDIALVEIAELSSESRIDFKKGVYPAEPQNHSNMIVSVNHNNLKLYSEVLESNEVFILGYPSSLGLQDNQQIDYERPLLRKGIVAGKNDKNNTIILDCPVYQGNSGGIVIQVNQVDINRRDFNIIGVVSQFIPFAEIMESKHHGYQNINLENSGYSVVESNDNIINLTEQHQ